MTGRAVPRAAADLRLTAVVADAVATLTRHHRMLLGVVLAVQAVTAVVVAPLVVLLLRAALAVAEVRALTEASLGQLLRDPVALLLLLLLVAVASAAVILGQGVIVLLARDLREGLMPSRHRLQAELRAVGRRLAGPQLVLLAGYAFVIVPLGNLEVAAFLTRGVELPPFIAAELQKTPLGTAAWAAGLLAVLYANVRLVLTPTVLLTAEVGVAGALARSWRLTRRRSAWVVVIVGGAWVASAVVLGGAVLLALSLLRVGQTLWPAAAPAVAGVALTGVQLLVLLVSGVVVALVTLCLVTVATGRSGFRAPAAANGGGDDDVARPPWSRRRRLVVAVAVLGVLVVTTGTSIAVVREAERGSVTAVAAHRGVADDAVENTLESLRAAGELGADYVELDVQQSADGGLVVVHDTNLRRIARINRAVPDMSFDELVSVEIAQGGHRSRIPSFEEFAALAAELDVALLIELRTHGREHGDYLGDIVEIMRDHDLLAGSRVQSFDREVVDDAAQRFPDLTMGWVIAFHRGPLDAGAADFITLEQASYTPRLLTEARESGVELFVWTVSDATTVRQLARDGVDGLITGSPGMALRERATVEAETTVADRLADELRALAGWW